MTKVIYSNLFSATRANVLALLTSSNVPNPTVGSAEYKKWIYSREPDVKATDFKGYPILIVGPAVFRSDPINQTADAKSKSVNFDVIIEVRTSDRGYGSKDGQGLTNMDSISDDILETFNDRTNRMALSQDTLAFCNLNVENVENIVIADELIYRREVVISFSNRMKISA